MTPTAYSGEKEGLRAVLSGAVDFTNASYSAAMDALERGKLKCLGISGKERSSAIPEVPPLGELVPESEQYMKVPLSPFVLQVSKDVDPAVVEVLREAANAVIAGEEWNDYVELTCQDKLFEQYTTEEELYDLLASFESMVSWMLYEADAAQYSPEEFHIPQPAD